MKSFLKKILVAALSAETRLVLRKYKPRIVAVTGSVGKTSAKDALYAVLSGHFFVRKSEKSFNSEIGIPLTILGCDNAWSDPLKWMRNIVEGLSLILLPNQYPEWLVLEVGADHPGDIQKMASWLHPDVVIFTRFAKTPVHVEFFASPEALFEEKKYLIKALKKGGILVLNYDDEKVRALSSLGTGRVVTFGFEEGADVRGVHLGVSYADDALGFPSGAHAKIDFEGNSVPLAILGTLGKQQLAAALAACATGIALDISLVDAVGSFNEHHTPPGRMRLIAGIKETLVIDDSYNSSPVAALEALATLLSLRVRGKKIAVLGDMLELGAHTASAHKEVGERAAKVADLLITVGIRAEDIAEGALAAGFPESKILQFERSSEAGKELEMRLQSGDVVLVKGSAMMRMERVVEEVMAEPERAKELLVRQEGEWKRKA